jgi:hypothetical protein
MIVSARSFRNSSRRALGERVCLRVRDSGSIGFSGEGDHEGRPYGKTGFVGATLVVALHDFQEVT